MDADDLVDTVEMYLKAVLELEEEGVVAMRARLVERFDHSSPTVSQTVERLRRDGLVELDAERRLELTDAGRRQAASVMRKHRLAEVFLEQVIGLEWEQLHEEACRWEHVMSDRVEQLLDERLDHPERTPYGNPLHGVDGVHRGEAGRTPEHGNLVRLAADAGGSTTARLDWIGEPLQADPGALGSLRRNGVVPGTILRLSIHGPSLLVQLDGDESGEVDVPHQLAVHLFGTALVPASQTGRAPVSRPTATA